MTQYIDELYKHHLSAWFILPICGVNLQDFQSCGFLNTYITEDCSMIFVVVERSGVMPHRMHHLKLMNMKLNQQLIRAFGFRIDPEFINDVKLYREGKYTELSEKLKTIIVNYSGLSCLIQNDEVGNSFVVEMDLRLASLFPQHRQAMEEFLAEAYYNEEDREEGLEIFRNQTELLSKPKPEEFIRLVSVT